MEDEFKRMEALIPLQNDGEFEFFVAGHPDLLRADPVRFISCHVRYYAYSERVDKELEVIARYKNGPYISMTVEDLLDELKTEVERLKEPPKVLSDEGIKAYLLSGDVEKIAVSLKRLSGKNIREYLPSVRKFLMQKIPYKYKTLALFILIEQKVEGEFEVEKDGMIYTLQPTLLDLPFDTFEYAECKNEIENADASPQVKAYAVELLNACQIKRFPDSFLSDGDVALMKTIFLSLAREMLHAEEVPLDPLREFGIPEEKFDELVSEIEKAIRE